MKKSSFISLLVCLIGASVVLAQSTGNWVFRVYTQISLSSLEPQKGVVVASAFIPVNDFRVSGELYINGKSIAKDSRFCSIKIGCEFQFGWFGVLAFWFDPQKDTIKAVFRKDGLFSQETSTERYALEDNGAKIRLDNVVVQ